MSKSPIRERILDAVLRYDATWREYPEVIEGGRLRFPNGWELSVRTGGLGAWLTPGKTAECAVYAPGAGRVALAPWFGDDEPVGHISPDTLTEIAAAVAEQGVTE